MEATTQRLYPTLSSQGRIGKKPRKKTALRNAISSGNLSTMLKMVIRGLIRDW